MIETRIQYEGGGYRDGERRVEIDVREVTVPRVARVLVLVMVWLFGTFAVSATLFMLAWDGPLACAGFAVFAPVLVGAAMLPRLVRYVETRARRQLPGRTIRLDSAVAVSTGGVFTELAPVSRIDEVVVAPRLLGKLDVRVRVGEVHHTLGEHLEEGDADELARELRAHIARHR